MAGKASAGRRGPSALERRRGYEGGEGASHTSRSGLGQARRAVRRSSPRSISGLIVSVEEEERGSVGGEG